MTCFSNFLTFVRYKIGDNTMADEPLKMKKPSKPFGSKSEIDMFVKRNRVFNPLTDFACSFYTIFNH